MDMAPSMEKGVKYKEDALGWKVLKLLGASPISIN